ncbi:MAG: hypothetical protein KA319_07265 [Ferruginibacter sp.]|nr:hypothetical protein [Ferruginibacter sp.]
MPTISNIKKTRKQKISGLQILEKILLDRKMFKEHLKKGGTLEQLKEKGIKFASI